MLLKKLLTSIKQDKFHKIFIFFTFLNKESNIDVFNFLKTFYVKVTLKNLSIEICSFFKTGIFL